MTKGWSWSPRAAALPLGGNALDLGNPKFPRFGAEAMQNCGGGETLRET